MDSSCSASIPEPTTAKTKEPTYNELVVQLKQLQDENNCLKRKLKVGTKLKRNFPATKRKFDFERSNFRSILLRFYYIGWCYDGYVKQDHTENTVEQIIFDALLKTCLIRDRESSNYHRCGRTDKGVSSFGQVISITVRSQLSEENQSNLENELLYCKILNRVLPNTIQCIGWCPITAKFSARFDCKHRTYKYLFPKGTLNIEKMRIASQYLVGSHDFRNFCKMDVSNGVTEFKRNINSIDIQCFSRDESNDYYSMYILTIVGNAFLWHQVRYIMSVLLLIGDQREHPDIVKTLLDVNQQRNRPDYGIANELPLNLHSCYYELKNRWYFDVNAVKYTHKLLNRMLLDQKIKESMIQLFLNGLAHETQVADMHSVQISEYLITGSKQKSYVPIMNRKLCKSLSERLETHNKKERNLT